MSYIYIKHHHLLDSRESRGRVERVAQYLRKKYGADYVWKGNRLISKHKGCLISANLHDHTVELRIKLSLLLSPARRKIEKALRVNLNGVLGDRETAPEKIQLSEGI